MNNRILGLMLISAILTSCARKDDISEDLKRQLELENLMSEMYVGGKAGSISIKGMVTTKSSSGEQVLDDRLSIEQNGGKGRNGKIQTETKVNEIDLSNHLEKEDLLNKSVLDTYINFGCKDLTTTDLAGLKEEKYEGNNETRQVYMAEKIFICDKLDFDRTILLAANTVELRNAYLQSTALFNLIAVNADVLFITGTNVIESKSPDSGWPAANSQSVSLTVTRSIHGEGKLLLRTIGANWMASKPK